MQMKFLNGALAVCAITLGLTVAIAAGAQAGMGQPPAEPGAPSYSGDAGAANSQKVDDATLKRAAAAYVKVQDITLKTRKVLNNTENESQKNEILEKAESEKIAAVKAQGMQPQEYNRVIMLVQADNNLQHKFLGYVHQAQGAPSGTM